MWMQCGEGKQTYVIMGFIGGFQQFDWFRMNIKRWFLIREIQTNSVRSWGDWFWESEAVLLLGSSWAILYSHFPDDFRPSVNMYNTPHGCTQMDQTRTADKNEPFNTRHLRTKSMYLVLPKDNFRILITYWQRFSHHSSCHCQCVTSGNK